MAPRPSADEVIAELAAAQHGVVARWQLLAAGLTAGEVDHRRARARLHAVRPGMPGVYLVGHTAAPELAVESAALLLCRGRPAALARWSAASLHGMGRRRAVVELVQVGHQAPRCPSVRTSVVRDLPSRHVVRRRGLWVTTPARTVLDLAADLPEEELARCLDRGRIARVLRDDDLADVLEWAAGRRGSGVLARLLEDERDGGFSRSRAERRLRDLLRRAGLPAPRRNVGVLDREHDLAWPSHRVVVEFDGRGFHLSPRRWEEDRDRDGRLLAHGWRTLRITWSMLTQRPHEVVARAAAVLALAEREAAGSGPPAPPD